jgi:hypothetical protein
MEKINIFDLNTSIGWWDNFNQDIYRKLLDYKRANK